MKTFLECVKEAASVRRLKDDITRFYFELPHEMIVAIEDAADMYATQSNSHKHDELIQAIAKQTQIIENLVSGKRVVNLDEAIAYYKSLHAMCIKGAVDKAVNVDNGAHSFTEGMGI